MAQNKKPRKPAKPHKPAKPETQEVKETQAVNPGTQEATQELKESKESTATDSTEVKEESNVKSLINPKMEKAKYQPKDSEKHLIHVQMEVINYDRLGNKLSKPTVQMFHLKEWPIIEASAPKQGYTLTILFDPRKN